MVDLRKGGGGWTKGSGMRSHGTGGPFVPLIVMLVIVAATGLWVLNLFFGERDAQAAPRTVVAAPVQPRARPVAATLTDNGTWTRIAWYWRFDPRKDDRYLTRVVDQYGCAWWMEIGARVSGYKYRTMESFRNRAYRDDGYPDCPKSEMPKPNVAYFTDAELKEADIDQMGIVSRTTVRAKDPGLVAYYRARRDEAAKRAASGY